MNSHTGSSFDEFLVEEKIKIKTCTNCGKGILTQNKVRHLTFETCNLCEYRKKV